MLFVKKFPDIVFWDLYNSGMGGIERLIITLTEEFSKTRIVKVIANKQGTVYKTLINRNVDFLFVDFSVQDFNKCISSDDILITFGTYREFIQLKDQNPKLLLWRVYPSLVMKTFLSKLLMRFTFINLANKGSVFFMDQENHVQCSQELHYNFEQSIIPIPIQIRQIKTSYKIYDDKVFNISYLGRGTEIWKIKPLKRLVIDLTKIQDKTFIVHIFTNITEFFQKEITPILTPNVSLKFYLNYFDEKLSAELLAVSNLHFSMGTSALEGAVLGIPTLIADGSFKDIPCTYKYRFIKDDILHYAGIFIDQKDKFEGHSIAEIITLLEDTETAHKISIETKEKVKGIFSPERICASIDTLNPQGCIHDVLRFMPSYWIRKLQS